MTAAPVLAQTSTVSESREVPFAVIEQPNFSALAGARTVIQAGAPGVELVTFTVTEMGDVWCKAEIDGVSGYVSRYFFQAIK